MVKMINRIIDQYDADPLRLMDILVAIQRTFGFVSRNMTALAGERLGIGQARLDDLLTRYKYFKRKPPGRYPVYINDSIQSRFTGRAEIIEKFEQLTGCSFPGISEDLLVGLHDGCCMGMNDLEPSAMLKDHVFTRLTPKAVEEIIRGIRDERGVDEIYAGIYGEGKDDVTRLHEGMFGSLKQQGPILSQDYERGDAIRQVVRHDSVEALKHLAGSGLIQRGYDRLPMAKEIYRCRIASGIAPIIFCHADEGEPGTFSDRVVLTERIDQLLEGMVLAAFMCEAERGVLYLRSQYAFLEEHIMRAIAEFRQGGLLGTDIAGCTGFHFTIEIQYGPGVYACGDNRDLIAAAEGRRGESADLPPEWEQGIGGLPTLALNAETACALVKVMAFDPGWYAAFGTKASPGAVLMSVSGDCRYPGIYDLEYGFTLASLAEIAGTVDVQAALLGGPAGELVEAAQFDRIVRADDLKGGASVVFVGKGRNLIEEALLPAMRFLAEESCSTCEGCREQIESMLHEIEKGSGANRERVLQWPAVATGRKCRFGKNAPNLAANAITNFPHLFGGANNF